MALNLRNLARDVLYNCDISDSRHAGLYSICGLALRLRDLHKWENELNPWEEGEPADVLSWIGDKEEQWENLAENDYRPLTIGSGRFDPFDTGGINHVLGSEGLFYGAGYAYSLKPTFFLSEIEKTTRINGQKIVTVGKELARDMLTLPALTQDGLIILRKTAAMLYLWDQIAYITASGRDALKTALSYCDINSTKLDVMPRHLQNIYSVHKDTFIYHEIGEMNDTVFRTRYWREIIAAFPHTPIELMARALKDLLADTNEHGPLRHFLNDKNPAAIAFYAAFMNGFAKQVFPELRMALKDFKSTLNWQVLENAVNAGYEKAKKQAQLMIDIYLAGKKKNRKWTREQMEAQVVVTGQKP